MDEKDKAQEDLRHLQEKTRIGVYQHYKGPYYTLFAMSVKEDTCETLVHYYSHDHKTRWTRTWVDFCGTVSEVARGIHDLSAGAKRFQFVRDATADELLRASGLSIAALVVPNPLGS
jgi:hypothetical protein